MSENRNTAKVVSKYLFKVVILPFLSPYYNFIAAKSYAHSVREISEKFGTSSSAETAVFA